MQYSHSYSWDKPIKLPGQTDFCPPPPHKKLINKELKRNMQQRGWGSLSTPEKGRDART
jgi:hypothetical protein